MIGTTKWRPDIDRIAAAYPPLDPVAWEAMLLVESNGKADEISDSDAIGLGQIIYKWHQPLVDEIAAMIGIEPGREALLDPEVNLHVSARLLRWFYVDDGSKSWERAVRKYFTGSYANDGEFQDGQGTTLNKHIAKFRKALDQVQIDRGDAAPPTETEDRMGFDLGNRKIRIAIGAGHANTSGGNAFERGLNKLVTNEIVKLLRASDGFDVRCYTPNDGLGSFNGELDDAAAVVRTWMSRDGWYPDICHEVHQEGLANTAVRGGFFIYPDSVGLSGRKASGFDNIDLDVKAAAGRMAEIMVAAYGGVTRWRPTSRGMSERETGVAEPPGKYRLGVFGAWSDSWFANNACCFISEGATYTNAKDLALMKDPAFPKRQALGIVQAYIYLATTRGNWTYPYRIGIDGPAPDPDVPTIDVVPAIPVEELKAYVASGALKGAIPDRIPTSHGLATLAARTYRTRRSAPRHATPDSKAGTFTGGDVGPELEVFVGWVVATPDGDRYLSPWWTWFNPADFRPQSF